MEWGAATGVIRLISDVVAFLRRRPKVTLDGVRRSPLWLGGSPVYDVTQIWFKNRPLRATAKDVTALTEFFAQGAATPRLSVHGQWATTTAPGHIGFDGFTSVTDIPAGHTAVKLLVLLKYRADNSAYAFAAENLQAYGDGRHPDFELPVGEYRMRASLAGSDIEKTFWFDVKIGGAGTDPVVSENDW